MTDAQKTADEAAAKAAAEKAEAEAKATAEAEAKAAADAKAAAEAKSTGRKPKARMEKFEATRPDGTRVVVERNIDTGEQTVTDIE